MTTSLVAPEFRFIYAAETVQTHPLFCSKVGTECRLYQIFAFKWNRLIDTCFFQNQQFYEKKEQIFRKKLWKGITRVERLNYFTFFNVSASCAYGLVFGQVYINLQNLSEKKWLLLHFLHKCIIRIRSYNKFRNIWRSSGGAAPRSSSGGARSPSSSGGAAPWAPIWETAAEGSGKKKKLGAPRVPHSGRRLPPPSGAIKKIGAPAAPQMVLKTGPVPWGFRICAWFWNWTTGKWFLQRMNIITERSSTILVYTLYTVVKYLAQNLNDNYPRKEIKLFLKTVPTVPKFMAVQRID